MIQLFKIDDKDFTQLGIVLYKVDSQILSGVATERTQAVGWKMFRDPEGVIKNLSLTIKPQISSNQLFMDFLKVMDSFGTKDFRTVHFISAGENISQKMYGASYTLDMIRIDDDGVEHFNQTPVEFIAEEAYIT